MKAHEILNAIVEDVSVNINDFNSKIMPNEKYTILIGNTGSGKTLLTNILLGCEIEPDRKGGTKIFKVKNEIAEVGHEGNKSKTAIPGIYGNYIDCPGFKDSDANDPLSQELKELKNALYIENVFQCKIKKVLLVIANGSVEERGNSFIELVQGINEGIDGGYSAFIKNFGVCFTKVSSDDSYDPPSLIMECFTKDQTNSVITEFIKGISDKVVLFTKSDDEISLIKGKLDNLLNTYNCKVEYSNNLFLRPKLSFNGNKQANELIDKIFYDIDISNTKAVNKYVVNSKFFIDKTEDLENNFNNIKVHNKTKCLIDSTSLSLKELLNINQNKIKASQDISNLVDNLLDLYNKVDIFDKAILNSKPFTFSNEGLIAIKYIAHIVNVPTDSVATKVNIISNMLDIPIIFEQKISNFVEDINTLESQWNYFENITKPNNLAKGLTIGTGVIGGAVGGAAGVIAAPLTFGTSVPVGVAIGGGIGTGIGVGTSRFVGNVNKELVNKLKCDVKISYLKIPKDFAELWMSSHETQNAYIDELKNELKLIGNTHEHTYDDLFI